MTKTDNLVERGIRKLDQSLSDVYQKVLDAASEDFFKEFSQLDVGLTERLGRRPISDMEIRTVCKKAENQFKAMCLRERNRGS